MANKIYTDMKDTDGSYMIYHLLDKILASS